MTQVVVAVGHCLAVDMIRSIAIGAIIIVDVKIQLYGMKY